MTEERLWLPSCVRLNGNRCSIAPLGLVVFMDEFFFVLVLLLLAFPIMAIAALVKTVGLGRQLRRVEVRLAALERAAAAPMPGVSEQRAPAEPSAPTETTIAEPIAVPPVVPLAPVAPGTAAPNAAEQMIA